MEPYTITLTHTLSAVAEVRSVYSFLETPPQTGEELITTSVVCQTNSRDFIQRRSVPGGQNSELFVC